jgi:hypothetical protein
MHGWAGSPGLGTPERVLHNRKVGVEAVSSLRFSGWLAHPPGASVPVKRRSRRCPILSFHADIPRTSTLRTQPLPFRGKVRTDRPNREWRVILIPAANGQPEYQRAEPHKASGRQVPRLHELAVPECRERGARSCAVQPFGEFYSSRSAEPAPAYYGVPFGLPGADDGCIAMVFNTLPPS